MLTKDDLLGLGISPGPMFSTIFKAAKAAKTKEEAIAIAVAIRDGNFVRQERLVKTIDPDSVLHWCLDNKRLFPSAEKRGNEPSISEVKRMLEQGAITMNGKKPKADDKMERDLWELVFFKGAQGQCTVFFDMESAPLSANWRIPVIWKREKSGLHTVTDWKWVTKEEFLVDHAAL